MPYKINTKNNIWLCIRFTHLSLNSLGFSYNESNETQQAIAITYQQVIHRTNSIAASSGVKPGMSVSYALLINPSLELHQREPYLEQKKLQDLSYWAYNFTSLVSLHDEHMLVLEIGKSHLLFKNLENILTLIKKDLSSFKVQALFGIANTPKASILLSIKNHQTTQNIEEQLDSVSLNVIDQSHKKVAQLNHCGFKTLGDIKKINRADLGARFGKDLLIYLNQVYGDIVDPQHAITPPETFHAYSDFAEPIQNSTWIQQQIEQLLDELSLFLSSRQLSCRSFVWRFFHENNRLIKTVNIGISSQKEVNATLKELSQLKLENIQLEWEFSRIELSCKDLLPNQLFNNDLFDPIPSKEQFQQLRDKLITRLGSNAVYGIEAQQEYLPEMANKTHEKAIMSIKEQPSNYKNLRSNKSKKNTHTILIQHEQPLWLLENPLKLNEHCSRPILQGPLTMIHGPNRLTSQWWHKLQSRDYFIARQTNGRLLWIFYDRAKKNWLLHGLYG